MKKLTPTESRIVSALTRNADGMTRTQIEREVWPERGPWPCVHRMNRHLVKVHIRNIRNKFLMKPDCDLEIVFQDGKYVLVDLKDEGMPQ